MPGARGRVEPARQRRDRPDRAGPAAPLPPGAHALPARGGRREGRSGTHHARVAQTRQGPALRGGDARRSPARRAPAPAGAPSGRARGTARRRPRPGGAGRAHPGTEADRLGDTQAAGEADRATQARAAQAGAAPGRAALRPQPEEVRARRAARPPPRAAAAQLTLTTVSVRLPLGSATEVCSPGARPSSATATGDSADRRPEPGAASCELTIRQVCSTPSGSRTTTVEPKPTTPPAPATSSSTTTALAIFSRSLAILVSRCACSFLASWYSLFSFRSPHSRAVLMRSAISLRPWPSSSASSAFRASTPSAVIRLVPSCTIGRAYSSGGSARGATRGRYGGVRLEVGARRRRQQRVDLHDRRLHQQLGGGGRAGHEHVVGEAQVLPGVVNICLGDLPVGGVVCDGVQVQEIAEVDGGEERAVSYTHLTL